MIATLFVTVATVDELKMLARQSFKHVQSKLDVVLLHARDLVVSANDLPDGISRAEVAEFENGLPLLGLEQVAAARGKWVGFTTVIGQVEESLPEQLALVGADVHWAVFDWWASSIDHVPARLERSRCQASAYGIHTLKQSRDWETYLEQAGDPAYLLFDLPVSWAKREWLLDYLPAHGRALFPVHWLHGKVLACLEQQQAVVIQHVAHAQASIVLMQGLPDMLQALVAQSELVAWVGLLCAGYRSYDVVAQKLSQLIWRHRPWLLTDRAQPGTFYASVAQAFRAQCPALPVLRELIRQGEHWAVVRDTMVDDVQVMSPAAVAQWHDRAATLAVVTARCEWMRVDRVVLVEGYDFTFVDAQGAYLQLMALYRQPDGRWVLPAMVSEWSDASLDALCVLLEQSASSLKHGEVRPVHPVESATFMAMGNGRFIPGLEGYATLVQHAARYRWASRQGTLGRVLDCASGAGYGWHLLSENPSLLAYTGIDLNPEAIGFARRFIPPSATACQFEARLLDTLPKQAFDTVISFETIEHTDDPEVFLWDLAERIVPGGRLLLSLPTERWAGSHLNSTHWTNWNEARVRALCGRVFEQVELFRLRLSLLTPETLQSGYLHQGYAVPGEDEGFVLILQQPRKRVLAPRVVVQRRFALGDALLASSVLPAIRQRYPDCQVVVKTQVVEAFLGNPDVDILGCMDIAIRPDDIVINLDEAYEQRREAHIIEAYADVAGVVPVTPRLVRLPQDYALLARQMYQKHWLNSNAPPHMVAIHMAASSPDRIWPLAYWQEVIETLVAQRIGVILLGNGKDFDASQLPESLLGGMVSLVNSARLAETAAAIAVADVLIAPDSGLIHVANAVGTPVVGLFGMAEPAQRLPQQGASIGLIADIECKGCLKEIPPGYAPLCRKRNAECMQLLAPQSVWDALTTVLGVVPSYLWRDRLMQALPLPYSRAWNKVLQNTAATMPAVITPAVPTVMAKRKPRIGLLTLDFPDGACFRLRLGDPMARLAEVVDVQFCNITSVVLLDGRYPFANDQEFVDAMDMFIVQRAYASPGAMPMLEAVFASGKPVIYEMDDWLPGLPTSHPQYEEFEKALPCIVNNLHRFHLITVSTPVLADKVRGYNPNVAVLPNYLCSDRIPVSKVDLQAEKVTIGFAGTSTHTQDLRLIGDALSRIAKEYEGRVEFVFWGSIPPQMQGVAKVRHITQGVDYHEYMSALANLKIDIGLASLEPTDFNEGKSDIKFLEYAAIGAVPVLADVPAYRHLKERDVAVVLPLQPDIWFDTLAGLIESPEQRQQLALRALQYVAEQRVLENQLGQFVDTWNLVLPDHLHITMPQQLAPVPTRPLVGGDLNRLKRYRTWLKQHAFREVHAEQLAQSMVVSWKKRPVFNLLTVVTRSEQERLADTVDSLQQQLYADWRLIILADWEAPDPIFTEHPQLGWLQLDSLDDPELLVQAVNGIIDEVPADWMSWLPAGFRVLPHSLLRWGEAIHQHPDWQALYCDSDTVSPMGERFLPCLRPDFSPDYFRAMDYIGPAVAFSVEAVRQLGGFQVYPDAYVYDALLRVFEQHGQTAIGHVDDMLLSFAYAEDSVLAQASRRVALENHASRSGIAAEVGTGYVDGTFHFNCLVQGQPLVSIIIPNRDKLDILEPCVESLFQTTRYTAFELIIVDNRSEEPETQEYYQEIQQRWPQQVRIVSYDAPFNFSAQCNLGVAQASGDYVLLLNNDTEIVLDSWLERMLGLAQQPGVGAVGARLMYPETGLIQHAGIVLGLPGGMLSVADHVFEGEDMSQAGYMNRILTPQNYSAVTAACLLLAKSHYLEVGGMDEASLTVLYNDVDLCLKLQAVGYRNVYNPYAVLVHHHAKSIGRRTSDPRVALEAAVREHDELKTFMTRWVKTIAHDPGYNRHLSLLQKNMWVEAARTVSWDTELKGKCRVLGLPVSGGSGEYRVSLPLTALQQKGWLDGDILQPASNSGLHVLSVAELARLAPHSLLVHTAIGDNILDALKSYRQYLPDMQIVFGMDDLVGAVPEKSSAAHHWRKVFPDARSRLRKALKQSDVLVVSTEPLAEFCKGMIDDIRVIPNRLPRSLWEGIQSERGIGRKPRVGWVGASQHRGDLELVIDVVKQTADEVDWIFMGMCLPELRPYVAEVHPFVSFQVYPEKMAALNLDLAIAPLEVNSFNEAKSNLRLLEYGWLGWPVICTDIFPYQAANAPVCRLPNQASLWIDAIRARAHDIEAAYKEGNQLQSWVHRHFMLEDHLDDWRNALISKKVKNF